MGDGDAWVVCALGHRHWGRFGAAGLLVVEPGRAVLQHRAVGTHEGGTWGLPGGARDSHEDAVATALREAREEAGIPPTGVEPVGLSVDDHGGWSYTTVAARPIGELEPHAANWESADMRWCGLAELDTLSLHPGFAASWPRLRRLPAPLAVVVDAANVVGATPDGWWRDRAGAAGRLLADLAVLAAAGLPADALPDGVDAAGLGRLLPELVVVLEGAGRRALRPAAPPPARLRVLDAPGDGDDLVADTARRAVTGGRQVLVVTADRGLRARLPADAAATGPSWLGALLPVRDAPVEPSTADD